MEYKESTIKSVPMPKVGEYSYRLHGRQFCICVCDYSQNGISTHKPVPSEPLYSDREEARRRVYELNGWNYKPRKQWKR